LRRLNEWHADREAGALSRLALDGDAAAVGFDDFLALEHPDAQAVGFGAMKWAE
jgi:hypothetical protein